MRISITGTPGTGKHEIARRICEETEMRLVDLGQLAKDKSLVTPDPERNTQIVDIDALKSILRDEQECVFVSNYAELVPNDLTIVIRCHPEELARRLKARNWPPEKIRENLEAECLDYCLQAAVKCGRRICEVDNTRNLEASVRQVLDLLDDVIEPEYGKISYSAYVDRLDSLL